MQREHCNSRSTLTSTEVEDEEPREIKRLRRKEMCIRDRYSDNSFFKDELDYYFKHYTGRPNPIFFCANLSERLGGAKIYLKREDLNHLGAHKINNTLGQCLLAKRMGKKRIVAETGAGQQDVYKRQPLHRLAA